MTDGSRLKICRQASLGPFMPGEKNKLSFYLLNKKIDTSICPYCNDYVVSGKHSWIYPPTCSFKKSQLNSKKKELEEKYKTWKAFYQNKWTKQVPPSDTEFKEVIHKLEERIKREPLQGVIRTNYENAKYFEEFFGTGTTIDVKTKKPTIFAKNMYSNPIKKCKKGTFISGLGTNSIYNNFITKTKTGCNSWFSRYRIPDIYCTKSGFNVCPYNLFEEKELLDIQEKYKDKFYKEDENKINKNKYIKIKKLVNTKIEENEFESYLGQQKNVQILKRHSANALALLKNEELKANKSKKYKRKINVKLAPDRIGRFKENKPYFMDDKKSHYILGQLHNDQVNIETDLFIPVCNTFPYHLSNRRDISSTLLTAKYQYLKRRDTIPVRVWEFTIVSQDQVHPDYLTTKYLYRVVRDALKSEVSKRGNFIDTTRLRYLLEVTSDPDQYYKNHSPVYPQELSLCHLYYTIKKIKDDIRLLKLYPMAIHSTADSIIDKTMSILRKNKDEYLKMENKNRSLFLRKAKVMSEFVYDFSSNLHSNITKIILNRVSLRSNCEFLTFILRNLLRLRRFVEGVYYLKLPLRRFTLHEEIKYYKKVLKEVSMQVRSINKTGIPNEFESNVSKSNNSFVCGKLNIDNLLKSPISLYELSEKQKIIDFGLDYIVSQFSIGLYDKYTFNGKLRKDFRRLFDNIFSCQYLQNNTTLMRSIIKDIFSKEQFKMKEKGFVLLYSLENMLFYRVDNIAESKLVQEVEDFVKVNSFSTQQEIAILSGGLHSTEDFNLRNCDGLPNNVFSFLNADGVAGEIRLPYKIRSKNGKNYSDKNVKVSKSVYFNSRTPNEYVKYIFGGNGTIKPDIPAKMFEKREQVKIRPLISTGMNAYVRLNRIVHFIEDSWKGYYPVYSLQTSQQEVTCMNSINYYLGYNIVNNKNRYLLIPLDYSKFDHTISKGAILKMLDLLIPNDKSIRDDFLWFQEHLKELHVTVGNYQIKYHDGMLSGWKITNIIESFMNNAFTEYVFKNLGLSESIVIKQTNGDDVYVVIDTDNIKRSIIPSVLLHQISEEYNKIGLEVHPTKNMCGYHFCEFLRVAYYGTWTVKYPFRSLCSFFAHKPTSLTDVFDVAQLDANMKMLTSRLGVKTQIENLWRDYRIFFNWDKFVVNYTNYLKRPFKMRIVPSKKVVKQIYNGDVTSTTEYKKYRTAFPFMNRVECERKARMNLSVVHQEVKLQPFPVKEQVFRQEVADIFKYNIFNKVLPDKFVMINQPSQEIVQLHVTTGDYNLDETILELIKNNKLYQSVLGPEYKKELENIAPYVNKNSLKELKNGTLYNSNLKASFISHTIIKVLNNLTKIFNNHEASEASLNRLYKGKILDLQSIIQQEYQIPTKAWEYIFNVKELKPSCRFDNQVFNKQDNDLISLLYKDLIFLDPKLIRLSEYEENIINFYLGGLLDLLNMGQLSRIENRVTMQKTHVRLNNITKYDME